MTIIFRPDRSSGKIVPLTKPQANDLAKEYAGRLKDIKKDYEVWCVGDYAPTRNGRKWRGVSATLQLKRPM